MSDKDSIGKRLLEKYEEKRKYPRIVVDCSVSMQMPDGKIVEAMAHDISPGGIQLRSDKQVARIITAENEKLKQGSTSDFEISFMLTLDGKEEKLQVRCKLAHTVRLDENQYAMGVQFTSVDVNNRKLLKRFIESSMEPM